MQTCGAAMTVSARGTVAPEDADQATKNALNRTSRTTASTVAAPTPGASSGSPAWTSGNTIRPAVYIAWAGLDETRRQQYPLAGGLSAVELPFRGTTVVDAAKPANWR